MKKTNDTFNLKAGTILRFYKKNFGYGILNIIHNNEHFITTLTQKDIFKYLSINDILKIYLWTENKGAHEWECKIIGKIEDGGFIILNHSKKIDWHNNRKCLILNSNLTIKFFIYNIHQKDAKHFFSTETEMKEGKIIKISDSEAVLKYEYKLEQNSILKGHLKIKGQDTDLIGSVSDYNPTKNTYKISLLGTKEKERKKERKY